MYAAETNLAGSNVRQLNGDRQFFSHAIPAGLVFELNQVATAGINHSGVEGFDYSEAQEARLIKIKEAWSGYVDPYFALFKFYFRAAKYRQAEIIVWQAAKLLADRQGFSVNYRRLTQQTTDWLQNDTDQRHFLFCLKALGVIRLRRDKVFLAKKVLSKLSELDPFDEIGGGNFLQIAESF